MRIALFQPDIPQNTGTIIRTAKCLDVGVDIIEPCGFVFDDKKLKRSGMDYLDTADVKRFNSWQDFLENKEKGRLILLTTKAEAAYYDFKFLKNDTLLLGRESAGAPDFVHEKADARIIIPMEKSSRSLNIAISCSMVLGEALRQTKSFPY